MSSSIFSSNTSQQRWADKLNDHFIIYLQNPPSIFQVPKNIVDTNPEAYSPREFGLGPYHHFRRDLDDKERKKLAAIRKFLKPEQLHNFKSLVVDRMRAMEPSIRSCYDKYLDLDSDALAWAMAIDGVFFFHLLRTYSPPLVAGKLPQEVWMMENQFPIIVLFKIGVALVPPQPQASGNCMPLQGGGGNTVISDDELTSEDETSEAVVRPQGSGNCLPLQEGGGDEISVLLSPPHPLQYKNHMVMLRDMMYLCILHSPFLIHEGDIHPQCPHILGMMYQLVQKELSLGYQLRGGGPGYGGPGLTVTGVAAELLGLNALELLEKFPWEKHGIRNNSTNSSIEHIQIPSISQLQHVRHIDVSKSASGIAIWYLEDRIWFFLPFMRLNADSEVIIRNLVAYESALVSNNNIVSGSVDLMCGLIKTAEDVDLLKKKGIIETELPSEEVAKMFNGINKSSGMVEVVRKATLEMNEAYETYDRIDSPFRVRCSRFMKNHLIPSQKSVKRVLWILMVSLLVMQAFCQIYGCSDHWFSSK